MPAEIVSGARSPGESRRLLSLVAIATAFSLTGCLASTQQEVQLGADYAAQINRQLPLVGDPEVSRYITKLGDSLSKVADDRSLTWHFYVVDQPEINAFAVPGGYVYVNRGLVERAENMSQLAGVIGHEIGHVVKRHSVKQMQKSQEANAGIAGICLFVPSFCNSEAGAAVVQGTGAIVFSKFSREDEAQADQEGVIFTTRAHIDPHGIPNMFRILLNERKTNPGAVEALLASHPLEEDRITATNQQIAKIPPVQLQGASVDSPDFQAFKRRLMSLPRPPVKK